MGEIKEKLTCIADTLYSGDTAVGMAMMAQVIEDLAKVGAMISDEALEERYVKDGLMQALQAMEDGDGTLLADVITYEILEVIEAI